MTDVAHDLRLGFYQDIDSQLRKRLSRSGIELSAALALEDVAIRYFDYKRRTVRNHPRKVYVSRELAQASLSPQLQDGLSYIKHDFETGAPVFRYFSRQWLDLESNDILFNDWRVRHMHLGGPQIETDGYVQRTRQVLFVYLERESAYLINILDHGSSNVTAFAEPQLVDILRANWPGVIEHARAPGASELSPNDASARWALSRKRNGPRLSTGVETCDGAVYVPIGGGYMADGRSMNAVRCAFGLMNTATDLSEWCSARSQASAHHAARSFRWFSLVIRHVEWGVGYRVVEASARNAAIASGQILLPEYERR